MIETIDEEIKKEVYENVYGSHILDLYWVAKKLGVDINDAEIALIELNLDICDNCACWYDESELNVIDGNLICDDCINDEQ